MTAVSNKIEPIVIEKIYKHSIDKVFNAFSQKTAFEQWISPMDIFDTKILLFDFKVGGKYRIEFIVPETGTLLLGGEYVNIKHLQQICFTWIWEKPDMHAGINSLVTANFQERNEYTKLQITHENLSTLPATVRHTQGWNGTLLRLEQFLIKQD